MPFINDFPVYLAAFTQISDQHCCMCKKLFEYDKALSFEEENSGRFLSHRVVFPAVCNEPHFIHSKCLSKPIDEWKNDPDNEGKCLSSCDISCFKCNKKIGCVDKVDGRLSEYGGIENACDKVRDLLTRLKTEEVRGLAVNAKKLPEVILCGDLSDQSKSLLAMIKEAGVVIADFKKVAGLDSAARHLYKISVEQVEKVCVNKISGLIGSQKVDEAILFTKGLLAFCKGNIKSKVEVVWLDCCKRQKIKSKCSSANETPYYLEVKKIAQFFQSAGAIQEFYKKMLISAAESLLKCADNYEYSEADIECLKAAHLNGFRPAGKRLSDIYLAASKVGFEASGNVDLGIVNNAFMNLWSANLYAGKKVSDELRNIGILFFKSVGGRRFEDMRVTAFEILSSTTLDEKKIKEAKSWLDNVFSYGTRQQIRAVKDLRLQFMR